MKTYVIEREIPNAGKLTAQELKGISQKSCSVLEEMGPQIEWQQSYVTGD
ncbi:MAG TPA: nickel-binding protein, partial [Segetibacter sp.]